MFKKVEDIRSRKKAEATKAVSKLSSTHIYIGLSVEDMEANEHICKHILSFVSKAVPKRILRADGGAEIELKAADHFEGHPCFKITYWCYHRNQYCSECHDYGCPGECQ